MSQRYFIYCFFFLLVSVHRGNASVTITPYTTVYPINPAQRGTDLIAMFQALSVKPYSTPNSEIGIQTTNNGFIPFIQNIDQSAFNTLLIVTYRPTRQSTVSQNLYIVIPVEQIVEMVYSYNATITATNFVTSVSSGILPYYSVNMSERAADIQSVVNTLLTRKPYNTNGAQQVTLSTNLIGTNYYAPFSNGVIPDVQSISFPRSSNQTLMLVTYQINNLNYYIIVSPEQVSAINYYPKGA